MGTYSPAPVYSSEVHEFCQREVLGRFLAGLKADGLEFRGVIFIGLMIGSKGVRLLEFNVRFGDPETQSLMMRWESGMAEALYKTATGKLKEAKPVFSAEPAVCVVLASGGYPGDYAKGFPISGLEAAAATGAKVFHAGTAMKDGQVINTGGRVLGITARGASVRQALATAYRGVDEISWKGAFCRRDIAWRALAREK
jgi:phosphoribosylamine--glycine ligase